MRSAALVLLLGLSAVWLAAAVPANTCDAQKSCIQWRVKPLASCTWQVCLSWRPGNSCQLQPDDTIDQVCVKSSAYVKWGYNGTTHDYGSGETACKNVHSLYPDEETVCNVVRCGETATFSLRDGTLEGLQCDSSGAAGSAMLDITGRYTFTCAPAAAGETPCSTCGSAVQTGDCIWKWAAPTTAADAAAASAPKSTTKCRCTQYAPQTVEQWLCSGFASCPGPVSASGRRRLFAVPDAKCDAAYAGTSGCFIVDHWDKIMELQGRGALNKLLVGAGDRTVGLDLDQLKCACAAWSLQGKPLVPKAPPAPEPPVTCPSENDPDDPAEICAVPSWKFNGTSFDAVPAGYFTPASTCKFTGVSTCNNCVGQCCSDTGKAICPTSSCHANELGDTEMNCPNSANCPVADPGTHSHGGTYYNATCQKMDPACTANKCLGYVNCLGAACPEWQGVACFYLGASANWKVCSSAVCAKKDANAPKPKKADSADQCVYGGYRWRKWAPFNEGSPTKLNPNYADNGICKLKGGTCSASSCFGKCCGQYGTCPTSSCRANQLGTDERNCPKSARCPVRDTGGYNATCVPHDTTCRNGATVNKPHCLGWVRCLGNPCPDWEGQNCFYNGVSNNWKLCTDRTCATSPNLPKSPLDKCDPVETAIDAGENIDARAAQYCEFKNWRVGTNPLTGHTGRCGNADPTKCHGNCDTVTGKCPTSSCIANALGDVNLNCPNSARCPVRQNGAICDVTAYNGACTGGNNHCLGRVKCAAGTPCPVYEGMDCFYDGNSNNWKLCWSDGCFDGNSTATQSPVSVRLTKSPAVPAAPAPASCVAGSLGDLKDVGGEAFLSTLAATLNVYKDRIENSKCAQDDPDFIDSLVTPNDGSPCACKSVKTLLDDANLALADLAEAPYDSDTSTALPLDAAMACLESINTASPLTGSGAASRRRRLLSLRGASSARGAFRSLLGAQTLYTQDTYLASTTCAPPPPETTIPQLTAPPILPLTPVDYNYTIPINNPFNTGADLCNGISSPNGGIVQLAGFASQPPASEGTVTLTNCSWEFTPAPGWYGDTSFCVNVTDGFDTVTECVYIHINPPQPPVARDDEYPCVLGQVCSIPLAQTILGNDESPDNLTLTVVGQPTPSVGTLVMHPDGSFDWTPPAGYPGGNVTFVYTITDGVNNATATVTLVIPPVTPLTPVDYNYTIPIDAPYNPPTGDDLCIDVAAQTSGNVTVVGMINEPAPSEGVLTRTGCGWSFNPAPGWYGDTSFCANVTDGVAFTQVCVHIHIDPPQPPIARDDEYPCSRTSVCTIPLAQTILGNDESPDNLTLTVVGQPTPSQGSLVMHPDGSFDWTPPANFPGGNVTFVYTVTDGVNNVTATVTLVIPPPGVLTPVDYNYTIPLNDPFSPPATDDFCQGVTTSNGGNISVVGMISEPAPAEGVLTRTGCGWSFDPVDGWHGDTSFCANVTDGVAFTQVCVHIHIDPPGSLVAADDWYVGQYNTPFVLAAPDSILSNDGPASTGGTLEFVQVTVGVPAADGALDSINPDGTFTFTPARGFRGNTTFTYQIKDGVASNQPTAVVNIYIPPPQAIVAEDDWFVGQVDTPFMNVAGQELLANDSSPNPDPKLKLIDHGPLSDPTAGTLVAVNYDGTFRFDPATGWTGDVEFPYTITDEGTGLNATAIAHIHIDPPGSLVAADDWYVGQYNTPFVLAAPDSILSNDGPASTGGTLEFVQVTVGVPAADGTLDSINPDGTFTFTPARGFRGNTTFTYQIKDGVAPNQPTAVVNIYIPPPQPLVAEDDWYVGQVDTPFTPPAGSLLLANDSSPNPDPKLKLIDHGALNDPTAGTLVKVNPDGSFEFDPATGWTGDVEFPYTITDDGTGLNATAIAHIHIDALPPIVAADDWYVGQYNTRFVLAAPDSILSNDGPASTGGTLEFVQVTVGVPAADGTLDSINPDGTFTFTPARGFRGNTTFTYQIKDGVAPNQPTAVVNIYIPPPKPILAKDDWYHGLFNQPFTPATAKVLLANDSSPNPDPKLKVIDHGVLNDTTAGTLTRVDPDGSFEFVPTTGWTGDVEFPYTITDDGTGLNATAIAHITIQSNPPPVAVNDEYACDFGVPCSIPVASGILGNDSSPTNTPISIVSVSPASDGTINVAPDGSFVWTPPANKPGFFGTVTFTYTIEDNYGDDMAKVTLVIPPPPLVAADDYYVGQYDTPFVLAAPKSILDNDGPARLGGKLEFVAVTVPVPAADGTLDWIKPDGTFQFTPKPGFSGNTTFTYKIKDGAASDQPTAVVHITIPPPGSIVAKDDYYVGQYDTPFVLTSPKSILDNDGPTSTGGKLEFVAVTVPVPAADGTLDWINPNGTFQFTPKPGFSGNTTFTYKIKDGVAGNEPTAVVHITIPAPGSIVAGDDYYVGQYNTPFVLASPKSILSNDGPALTGGKLEFVAVTVPVPAADGTLDWINPNGTFQFTPTRGFRGNTTFTYKIKDGVAGNQPTAVVHITIPPPKPILAKDDWYHGLFNQPFTPATAKVLLANDSSPNPDPKLKVIAHGVLNDTTAGTLVKVNPDGSFEFDPTTGWTGDVEFPYTITDEGTGLNATAIAHITIQSNPPPVAVNDEYACAYGKPCTIPVANGILKNDSSPSNTPIVITKVDTPSDGNVSVAPDGSFVWTPPADKPGFFGTVTFTYTIEDNYGDDTAKVTLIIPAPALVAADDYYVGQYNTPFVLAAPKSILDNDGPALRGGALEFVAVTVPVPAADGTLDWIKPDGTFQFTPTRGFRGNTTFTYKIKDGVAGNEPTAVVHITIPPPKPILAKDDWYTGVVNQPFTPATAKVLLANDSSPNPDPKLKVIDHGPLDTPAAGTLTVSPDGSFVFTPAKDWTGTVTFPYTITDDGTGLNATAVAHIVIQAKPPPVAVNDKYACDFGVPCSIPVASGILKNDSSPTNTPIVITGNGNPSEGTVVVNPDGSFVWTPTDPNFSGTVTFTYTIKDDYGTDSATVTLVIPPPQLAPLVYNYTAPYEQDFNSPHSVLQDLKSPRTNVTFTVLGLIKSPPPSAGNVTVKPDGTYVFTPANGWSGTTEFCVNVTDGYDTTSVCVTLVVKPPALTLEAADDYYVGAYNTPFVLALPKVTILGNDGPATAGGKVVFANVTVGVPAADGTLDWINPNGTFQFTPTRGFRGNTTFTYAITDGKAPNLPTAVVHITIPPPKPIVAKDDWYVAVLNKPFTPPAGSLLLANDSSPNPDPKLKVIDHGPLSDPAAGTLTVSPDGSFVFTPAKDWTGTVTFPYTITDDGTGFNATAVAHITINPVPPPVATDDAYTAPYNLPFNVPGPGILANDSTPNSGGVLQVVDVPVPSVGTLVVNPDGSFTYTPPQDFSGKVTFTYTINDGVSPANATALVVLTIPTPPVLIVPNNYTFSTPYNTPTDSGKTSNLLADIQSSDPTRPMKLVVKGLIKSPPASEGNVTVSPNGTYVFTPTDGFSGTTEFCVDVQDVNSGGAAKVCVTIVVPPKEPLLFVIPLEPSAVGTPAECPDAATMAQIAADFGLAIKSQNGVNSLDYQGATCTWLSPKKVIIKIITTLVTNDPTTKNTVLTAINSPPTPRDAQPTAGLCASPVTSALCNKVIGAVKVLGGCATTKLSCTPPELVAAKCVQAASMGSYVTANAPAPGGAGTATIPRPGKPKQAEFQGCCVAAKQPTTGSTCKKVRVGAKWRTTKTPTMNPLKQMGSCDCFNLREYVDHDMYTRPNHKAPKHFLAPYPFTASIATKVAAAKGNAAQGGWQSAGSLHVSCSAGVLSLRTQEEKGFMVGPTMDVVATCGNSAFTQMSSCSIANGANTTVTAVAGGVDVTSSEWDAACVCNDTGRRPVIKVSVADVIAGAACTA